MESSISSISSNFQQTIISRCLNLNCLLIPQINLIHNNGKDEINYKCRNGHNGQISLNDFLINSKNKQLNGILCNYIKKNHKNYAKEYCTKCNKFICFDCKLKHDLEQKDHVLIPINKIDNYCLEHNDPFVIYCNECEKSSCNYCPNEPLNHKVVLIQRMKISKEKIELLENEITKLKIFLKKMNKLYNNIVNQISESFSKFYELNELEIKFIEDLILSYKYAEKNHILNSEIILNLKNIIVKEIEFDSDIYNKGNIKQLEYLNNIMNEYYVLKESKIKYRNRL